MLDDLVHALSNYEVVLEPDQNTPEWWAGAPSVCRGPQGTFYLAARMREGHSPRGKRGYEMRLLESRDGIRFEPLSSITREAAGVPGFERPALVRDPKTDAFKLYGCAGLEQGWSILKWDDAETPAAFDPATAKPVLTPPKDPGDGFARTCGYKDPFVCHAAGRWHMLVIAFDRVERIRHFVSDDGEAWEPASAHPFMENSGWHNFFTRPACIVPMAVGFLIVYEGSDADWRDPVYNIATGLAYSPDLTRVTDLTPGAPLLKSTTPGDYHTWRYSHWLPVGDALHVYFEASRPNNTNEIRVAVLNTCRAAWQTPV